MFCLLRGEHDACGVDDLARGAGAGDGDRHGLDYRGGGAATSPATATAASTAARASATAGRDADCHKENDAGSGGASRFHEARSERRRGVPDV